MTFHHERRLGRALHHLKTLEEKVADWGIEGYAYRFVPKLDFDSGKKRVSVDILKPPPDEFGLLAGDCLHNLRSALDNLVHELALAYTGIDPLPEDPAGQLAFPISGPNPLKARKCREMIGCIHPDAQTFIKNVQPHNRGQKFASDPLWKLAKLSNVDKHRLPHLTVFNTDSLAHFPDAPERPLDLELWLYDMMRDGATIAQYTPPPGEAESEVNMHVHFTFGIAFGPRSVTPRWPVGPTLRWLHDYVVHTVATPLRRRFLI